jgi:glucose/arabinose dehydrogenase
MKALVALAVVALAACTSPPAPSSRHQAFDWRKDWAVQPGFSLVRETEGYDFPTAIAFVPKPGPMPKDPLYFVTELRGRVKVITNDRTVYTFAEHFFSLRPPAELPAQSGEVGLAGICLAPEQGYVYVTFAYQDRDRVLRNNIVRFQSTAGTFSLKPTSHVAFTDIFSAHVSAVSHQIGPCQVQRHSLWVGVGDGEQPAQSQNPHSVLGKILRITLDGRPAPGNPFQQDGKVTNPLNFVWASGLRNPFSLKAIGERLFVVDNGPDVDRFLEVHRGENYLWNGTDWSAGTDALAVLAPAVGAVQMDYSGPGTSHFPPKYQQTFFVASAGEMRNPTEAKRPGIVSLPYSLSASKLLSVPEFFLGYRGSSHQMLTGLARGPDGLYVTPLFPDSLGRTAILRVSYDPAHEHPFVLGRDDPAMAIMGQKGCFGCHALTNVAEGGSVGPRLDRDSLALRLLSRLYSAGYRKSVEETDRLTAEPFRSYRTARHAVLAAEGYDRVRLWLTYRIQEPRFDNAFSQMPNLGLSEKEAASIADFLLGGTRHAPEEGVPLWQRFPPPRHRYTLIAFVLGALAAVVGLRASSWYRGRSLQMAADDR